MIEPYYRLPVTLVVAQSILESNWGKSRFAVEGNNLFGIKEYDIYEPHMHAKNSKTNVFILRIEHSDTLLTRPFG